MSSNENRNKLVGERVRKVRERFHITQSQLSKTIESKSEKDQLVRLIEKGKRGLTAENMQKICRAYGVRPEYLMLTSEYMTEKDRIENELLTHHTISVIERQFVEMIAAKSGYSLVKEETYNLTNIGALKELVSCNFKSEDGSEIPFSLSDINDFISDIEEYSEMRLRRMINKKKESNNGIC